MPPRAGTRRAVPSETYDRCAEPVLALTEEIGAARGDATLRLVQQAGELLERFASDLGRAGAIPSTIPPARYAVALILDQAARANRSIDIQTWAAGARRYLFEGRDISTANLREFVQRAAQAGHDFDGIRGFLERCLARLDKSRLQLDRDTGPSWTGMVTVLVAGFVLCVGAWALHVEWKYHRQLNAVFAATLAANDPAAATDLPAVLDQLDALHAAAADIAEQARQAPLVLGARLLGFDAADRADAAYRARVQAEAPGWILAAIDEAIATEGDPAILYDAVRAWSVLSGQADWSPGYLAGWLTDRSAALPGLERLAPHTLQLAFPGPPAAQPDAELLDQAYAFAAEAREADRAYLEFRRSAGAAALPDWRAGDAVPGLADVVLRRSGRPLSEPIPGVYTAAGWAYARDVGAGVAVQTAREMAARLFPAPLPTANDTPDRVLDALQRDTLAHWAEFLADLRVRPFQDADAAVLVSGTLAAAESPLTRLLREVWRQSGGEDRDRDHALQLQIAATFGPAIQYVDQGGMAKIAALFASLNVALGAMDRDSETGMQRLMSAQERGQSIATLQQAPAVVVQIVEDVLAQTGASHSDALTNPLTRAWQAEVLPACRDAVDGRYPFVAEGPDAEVETLARFFGAGGVLERFFLTRAEDYLDTSVTPWRWKPEARFAGVSPESAAFIQRARAAGAGFATLSGGGSGLTLAALAERGKAFFAIGGTGGPVTTQDDSLRLSWPGTNPAAGAEVSFQTSAGEVRLTEPGPWGFLRLLEPFRLRERDEGQRFLIDLRSGGARIFLEVRFDAPANILSSRAVLRGLQCPQVL